MGGLAGQNGGRERGVRVAGRFEIQAEIGSGGAGTVYRATDLVTGAPVALKVMRGVQGADFTRFAREAGALARFSHPHVVRYVAHGTDGPGAAYLVMEWLDGEDLRARLDRAPLTLREAVTLGRCAAEGLAAVHAAGLLHRDIKPGNLHLPGGRVEDVKLIDFGLVRGHGEAQQSITKTGVLLGTPGYMAPEQARGQKDIDGRADLFSLGCVLYKCLTGQAPFDGSNLMAVMTKVILEDPAPIAELRPGVPPELADLVHRMLAKEPSRRPESADEVARALAAIDLEGADEVAPLPVPSSRAAGLTGREVRVAAVLLVGDAGESSGVREVPPTSLSEASSATPLPDDARAIDAFVAEQGGRMDRLANGARVITLARTGVATDQVLWAARCALALRTMLPSVPMALAMGVREITGAAPMGDAIERAARLLAEGLAAAPAAREGAAFIAIDGATAALLDGRFEVERAGEAHRLLGTKGGGSGSPALPESARPIVGRDWELSTIASLFRECVDGPSASAVLVTAPPGLGKSRLAAELVKRFEVACPEVTIWLACADAAHAASPLHLLAQVLESALSLGDLPPDARRRHILDQVSARLPLDTALRVAELLGEILRCPFPDADRKGLQAARGDAMIMGEQMRWAWETFAAAECAARPVALFLDDVHWADPPSMRFLDAALGSLDRLPFMVVLLARPDVHDIFPKIWRGQSFQEIRLKPLTARASERLLQNALGAPLSADLCARLAARADGNAFFLEELARSLDEARLRGQAGEDTLPETVIATVQARLAALDDETRRLLRAASVFGDVFWVNGVAALLGASAGSSIAPRLESLVASEILVSRGSSRFPGEQELAFRHALLREGAYSMLTDEDRALGHRLAGAWLESAGEADTMVLARHFERGGEPERAARHLVAAGGQAMRSLDLEAAVSLSERALAAPLPEDLRLQALTTLCHARIWRLEWREGAEKAAELARVAPPGSSFSIMAAAFQLSAAMTFAQPAEMMRALHVLTSAPPHRDAAPRHALALSAAVLVFAFLGRFGMVAPLLERLRAVDACTDGGDLLVRGWVEMAGIYVSAWKDGDPWAAREHAEAAVKAFTEAADRRSVAYAKVFAAEASLRLGAWGAAARALDAAEAGEPGAMIALMCGYHRGFWGLATGAFDVVERAAADRIERTPEADPLRPARIAEGHWLRSEIACKRGDLAAAEALLAPQLDALRTIVPLTWQVAAARLARVRVALGRAQLALEGAKAAMDALVAQGGEGFQGLLVRLAYAEALDASGDRPAARNVLAGAHERLTAVAARIPDEAIRATFLNGVEENAKIAALARAWLADGA